MSDLGTALNYFAQAIKDIANGLFYSISYFLNVVGINIDPNISGLIMILCIAYAIQMFIKDEFIKKLALILLVLLILGYVGINIEEIAKLIASIPV